MDELFRDFRPNYISHPYPPYHTGEYLEEYFFNRYNRSLEGRRKYIPVCWTSCYIEGRTEGLQERLDRLDRLSSYFVVSQHDDAIKETLPPDTIHFNAGGNILKDNNIPIPLICSEMPIEHYHKNKERDILASFIGSNTHRIRGKLYEYYANSENIIINMKGWNPRVKNYDYNNYIDISLRSRFMLCPRGYGPNSFRLYESFQLGCVPVVVTDKIYLPWDDVIDWADIAIIVKEEELKMLEERLYALSESEYDKMRNRGVEIYNKHFKLDRLMCDILRRVNCYGT